MIEYEVKNKECNGTVWGTNVCDAAEKFIQEHPKFALEKLLSRNTIPGDCSNCIAVEVKSLMVGNASWITVALDISLNSSARVLGH